MQFGHREIVRMAQGTPRLCTVSKRVLTGIIRIEKSCVKSGVRGEIKNILIMLHVLVVAVSLLTAVLTTLNLVWPAVAVGLSSSAIETS